MKKVLFFFFVNFLFLTHSFGPQNDSKINIATVYICKLPTYLFITFYEETYHFFTVFNEENQFLGQISH